MVKKKNTGIVPDAGDYLFWHASKTSNWPPKMQETFHLVSRGRSALIVPTVILSGPVVALDLRTNSVDPKNIDKTFAYNARGYKAPSLAGTFFVLMHHAPDDMDIVDCVDVDSRCPIYADRTIGGRLLTPEDKYRVALIQSHWCKEMPKPEYRA